MRATSSISPSAVGAQSVETTVSPSSGVQSTSVSVTCSSIYVKSYVENSVERCSCIAQGCAESNGFTNAWRRRRKPKAFWNNPDIRFCRSGDARGSRTSQQNTSSKNRSPIHAICHQFPVEPPSSVRFHRTNCSQQRCLRSGGCHRTVAMRAGNSRAMS